MPHEFYVEKTNGDRINLRLQFPNIEPTEAANRIRLSGDYEQVIACQSLTVFRRRGMQAPIQPNYRYGGGGKARNFFANIGGSGKQSAYEVRQ